MQPTLFAVLSRADSRALKLAEQAGAVLFVTVLTAIAAQISIPLPFTPVPFTFQPMVVLVGSAALGARLGMASQLSYLALGVMGLPSSGIVNMPMMGTPSQSLSPEKSRRTVPSNVPPQSV